MGSAIYVLFGAVFTVATALALGRIVLRRAAPTLTAEEDWPLSFITGSALLSLAVFVLLAAHLAFKVVFLAAGVAAIAAAVRLGAHRLPALRQPPLPRYLKWIFAAGFSVFTVLYFFTAMAPEFSADGSAYHLGLMARYLRARGFVDTPYNMYAQLSQGIEMLFAFAFAFGRHSAGALVHYAFFVALSFLILAYGRRIGHPAAGVAASLFFYTSPVVGIDGTSAYIDVAVAAILFAVFYLLQIWDETHAATLLPVIGLLAGFAFAAKYTAFLAVPYAVGYVLWRSRRLRPAVLVGLCALVLIAPWIGKNLLLTGNPVSPMLNRWFPNHYVHIDFEREWSRQMRAYGIKTMSQIPWELTVRGELLSGHIGPVFLLIPLALLTLRTSAGRRLLIPALLYSAPYFGNIGARFFIPPLPFWSLAIALVFAAWPRALGALAALACLLCWPGVFRLYSGKYLWALEPKFPVPAALRIESEDHWLSRKSGEYAVTRVIEAKTPPGSRIYIFGGCMEAYTTRELAVSFQSARGVTLSDTFVGSFSPDVQMRLRQSFSFPPQALRRIRIVATSSGKDSAAEWLVNELRLYSKGKEVRRSSEWRITASANPWDVPLAFDNSPITRWRAREPVRAGQSIEVDLFRSTVLDEVAIETHDSQRAIALRADIAGDDGVWRTATGQTKESAIAPPGFQGKAGMAELKGAGFGYLLIRPEDWGGKDVMENPLVWGLTEVGRAGTAVLYRIDVEGPQIEDK